MEVKTIAPGGTLDDAAQVRMAVFVREQGYAPELEFDEFDAQATHIVLYDGTTPVATGRLFNEGSGVYKLGRIAVLQAYRNQHLGARLVEQLMAEARALGATQFAISAQVSARGFYEKLGFRCVDESHIYPDGHLPHLDMVRNA